MRKNIHDYNFIKQLQSIPFVRGVWLFGSRARGDHRERADIDLAIVCDKDLDWLQVMHVIEGADTLLKIDCVRFEKGAISPALYENIIKDRKVIYAKSSN
jgi:predicted nucleotidyltransferase